MAVLALVGVLGHFIYQLCFMGGLSRTTVSNSSLILGCSPIVVTFLSAAVGHERVNGWHWTGALLSLVGIYLLAGRGAEISQATLTGDALCLAAVVCWSIYTVASRPLLERHSPMTLTGYSMAFGTLPYVALGMTDLRRLDWGAVSLSAWIALACSATFALYVAYLIWYTSVQRSATSAPRCSRTSFPFSRWRSRRCGSASGSPPRPLGARPPSSAASPSRGWGVPQRPPRRRRSRTGGTRRTSGTLVLLEAGRLSYV